MSGAHWRGLSLAFLAGLLLLRLITFLDYGVTWDEQIERRNALLTIRWYVSGFADDGFLEDDQRLYGSFFNVLVWLAERVSPLDHYETGHLLTTLLGFLSTVMSYRIGAEIAGPRAGLLSALSLSLTPVFYGHSFNNPKDVPFAALFAASLALSLHSHRTQARPRPRQVLALGALIGLAAGIRIVGLSLIAVPAALAVWRHVEDRRRETEPRPRLLPLVRAEAAALGQLTLVAGCVALLFWPYLQAAGLSAALDLVRHTAHFEWGRTVLFEGRQLAADQLPRRYLPVWFLVSMPEFLWLALAAGGFCLARRQSQRDERSRRAAFETLLVLSTVALPIAGVVVLRPVLYDGLRQVLFVLPPLAALVGVGLDAMARQRAGLVRSLGLGLACGSMALTARDMVALHPYQSIYFNRVFAGGLERAAERFETDYWGSSYKEAVDWLIAGYRPAEPGRVRVANVSNPFLTAYYLTRGDAPSRFEPVRQPRRARIVLATTRWGRHRAWPGRTLHVVSREGVALCYVIERDP